MIIDPPMNRRSGRFEAVAENPVRGLVLEPDEWLCYPAMVGPLQVHVYFHTRFMGLGCALANPFELAADERLAVAPDALLFFGVPLEALAKFGDLPTVFHEDEEAGVLVGAVPNEDRFGYFGYLKKLSLTLHNVIMMRRGRMPFHGAMVHIALRGGRDARLLILGDTATGKSESLYAFGQIDRAIIMSPQKVNARVVLPVTTLEEVLLERFESDET